MTVAISQGKQDDDAFILSLIPRMIKLGETVQSGVAPAASAPVAKPVVAKAPEVTFDDDDLFGDLDL